MGLFKKKRDPISERARELNRQIAALESQIQQLSSAPGATPSGEPPPDSLKAELRTSPPPAAAHSPPHSQPRLRSTALPHGTTLSLSPQAGTSPREPVFEELDHHRLQHQEPSARPEPAPELGIRKGGLLALWQRIVHSFRGPASSNPKLVSYLAAGSIQGLRPLRYEKRIARNRFLGLVLLLVLLLWGLVTILWRSR